MTPETKAALERLREAIVLSLGGMSPSATADLATAVAEIERLQADVHDYRKTLDAWKKADRDDLRSARAAGYEAGQRAMRERAAEAIECKCPFGPCLLDPCSRESAWAIRELDTTPEPDRSQTGDGSEPRP